MSPERLRSTLKVLMIKFDLDCHFVSRNFEWKEQNFWKKWQLIYYDKALTKSKIKAVTLKMKFWLPLKVSFHIEGISDKFDRHSWIVGAKSSEKTHSHTPTTVQTNQGCNFGTFLTRSVRCLKLNFYNHVIFAKPLVLTMFV